MSIILKITSAVMLCTLCTQASGQAITLGSPSCSYREIYPANIERNPPLYFLPSFREMTGVPPHGDGVTFLSNHIPGWAAFNAETDEYVTWRAWPCLPLSVASPTQ